MQESQGAGAAQSTERSLCLGVWVVCIPDCGDGRECLMYESTGAGSAHRSELSLRSGAWGD